MTFPPVQCLERSCLNTSVIAVVVGELYQRRVFLPSFPKIDHTCPQHVFKRLNSALTLTIRLWVISGTHIELQTERFMH
ncbi:hypothetical protein HanIR_Chr11g0546531 [Helianthus annuus]|nr:hypothetical protein HanIR_Chr11g0546531 [Helianthus annuus]